MFGSLPPHGSDLDLVATSEAVASITAGLTAAGFVRCRSTFVDLDDATSKPVEVIDVARWALSGSEERALFADAVPLAGYEHLARPAPHHAVLLLARRVVDGGALDAKRRTRLEEALAENPDAAGEARRREEGWGLRGAIDLLSGGATRAARLGVLVRRSGSNPLALAKAARRVLWSPPRRGRVVSLSGLDGAGKSTQAERLAATLERAGVPVVVAWSRLAHEETLQKMVRPVKRAAALATRRGQGSGPTSQQKAGSEDPVRAFRSRSELLTHVWTIVVVLVNVSSHRRLTVRHIRAGRTVICDRYVLDSVAHLHAKYGEQRTYPIQVALLRLLSPEPVAAFLLDVPAEAAYARKPERYDVAQLARQARLYREAQERLGATRLDGTRPVDELAAEIARAVWIARC